MLEIRDRLRVAHRKITEVNEPYQGSTDLAQVTSADPMIEVESAILQIRFACELIALASLAAHSPLGLTKDLLKSWHAGDTFRKLAEINAKCFPQPMKAVRQLSGGINLSPREALDQKGLEHIYGMCGNMLHRGVIRHTLSQKPRIYDLPEIGGWIVQIQKLLAMHTIELERHDVLFYVRMVPPEGEVVMQVVTLE